MRAAIGQFEHGSRNLLITRFIELHVASCVSQYIELCTHLPTFNNNWNMREAWGVLKSSRLFIYLNSTLADLTISLSNQSRNEFLMEVASLHDTGVPIISWFFFDSITCYSPYRLQNNRIFLRTRATDHVRTKSLERERMGIRTKGLERV